MVFLQGPIINKWRKINNLKRPKIQYIESFNTGWIQHQIPKHNSLDQEETSRVCCTSSSIAAAPAPLAAWYVLTTIRNTCKILMPWAEVVFETPNLLAGKLKHILKLKWNEQGTYKKHCNNSFRKSTSPKILLLSTANTLSSFLLFMYCPKRHIEIKVTERTCLLGFQSTMSSKISQT